MRLKSTIQKSLLFNKNRKMKIRLSGNARYIATIVTVLYLMVLQGCSGNVTVIFEGVDQFWCSRSPFVCRQRSIHTKRYLNPTPSSRRVTLATLISKSKYLRKPLNVHRREEKWQSRRQKIELSLNIPLGQRSTFSSMERP